MQRNRFQSAPPSLYEGNIPFTTAIIVANVVTLVLSVCRVPVVSWLAEVSLARPWTFLTYPLVSLAPFGLFFYGLWLYFIGGSLERSWGTSFYARYFVAVTLITSLCLWLGTILIYHRLPMEASANVMNWLPLSALTLAWSMLNPELTINLWGLIPIKAKWIGWAEVLIVFFAYGTQHPLLGLLALSGCFCSFLWVRFRSWDDGQVYSPMPRAVKTKPPKPKRSPEDKFTLRDLNPLEWIARWRRKRQFMRLWKDD